MVQTRRQSLAASSPRSDNGQASHSGPTDKSVAQTNEKSWAESHGAGRKSGVWGLSGSVAEAISLAGTLALMTATPAFAIYMCGSPADPLPSASLQHRPQRNATMTSALTLTSCERPGACMSRCVMFTKLDGSLLALQKFVQIEGPSGLWAAWPRPSLEAWGYVAGHGLLQAALLLGLPGRTHYGPVTPKGNVPVYKVCAVILQSHMTFPSASNHGNARCTSCIAYVCCALRCLMPGSRQWLV